MKLRPYNYDTDYPLIEGWITDERTHALWCARRFPWPLTRESFEQKLRELAEKSGDCPFMAVTEEGTPVGFVCWSPGPGPEEGRLKFVVVAPEQRGRGYGRELVSLAAAYGKSRGAKTVRLSVFAENTAARRCYAHAGFAPERVTEGAFPFHGENWGRCDMALRL